MYLSTTWLVWNPSVVRGRGPCETGLGLLEIPEIDSDVINVVSMGLKLIVGTIEGTEAGR